MQSAIGIQHCQRSEVTCSTQTLVFTWLHSTEEHGPHCIHMDYAAHGLCSHRHSVMAEFRSHVPQPGMAPIVQAALHGVSKLVCCNSASGPMPQNSVYHMYHSDNVAATVLRMIQRMLALMMMICCLDAGSSIYAET